MKDKNLNNNERISNIAITKDVIEGLKETIRNLYLADDIPWIIGYSGGKDSTATLQLVWLALQEMDREKLKKTVHIINTDTLVESPIIEKWVENAVASLYGVTVFSFFHILKEEGREKYVRNCRLC